nr:TPA_inf: a1.2 [Moesziomyces aphidis]
MFSIFAQTASVSVSESQTQPTNEGGRNDAVYGYSSCTVA